MRAMVLSRLRTSLELKDLPSPAPGPGQIRVSVRACGVCRTDLHLVDGELPDPRLPVVPGHEIVGVVDAVGDGVASFRVGDRAGVPWLAWACGECAFCRSARENLCERARFTGYTWDGGYAEQAIADARFAVPLPPGDDVALAPLLCAGLIGFRALRLAGEAPRLGLYGFGASAHILCQLAAQQGRRVFAFTREGDAAAQTLARSLGAEWAGPSTQAPPVPLDSAILFAPVGSLVPLALRAVTPGGTVVCAGIHMSDLPSFPYALLWGERSLRSVANLTREDARAFFEAYAGARIRTQTHPFPLERANEALDALRRGAFAGAAVLEFAKGGAR